MRTKAIALVFVAASLAGCDAATQIAGDAVQGEVRNAVAAQCQQVSQGVGIVAGRIAEVCKCTADTFVADKDLTLEDIGRERIEGIVNACAKQTRGTARGTGAIPDTAPTEETGG